ncbi:hypothetical protein RI578_22780 [Streptomyces sp. BB1-1-1]|uniref:helix-turn-helix domain-containing protein n=1 Tax=Streptomyces sp. BB1-1-1 TaxID=3074430 RepID=UPI002877C7C6|nr:hypothetical protein [Streptomyces sp. BB1-1-1]WND36936.1 hypothetical protein RI578_22780 [Streptomyces sp. BB1-1-1]
MNATDQPDEQRDDEPTVAHYQRADADKMPTTPAGQQAAVEGMLAARGLTPADRPAVADHNRRTAQRIAAELNRRGEPVTNTPSARLMADMLDLFNKYERERAAERALAGDTNPYDLDPLEQVRNIADDYTRHADQPDALADLLDLLADEVLTLDDIRALRLAGEAAVAATPRAIKAAKDRGMKPPQIAAELGLTPSRVYQVLRELAAEQAEQPSADDQQ